VMPAAALCTTTGKAGIRQGPNTTVNTQHAALTKEMVAKALQKAGKEDWPLEGELLVGSWLNAGCQAEILRFFNLAVLLSEPAVAPEPPRAEDVGEAEP
jgi:hypothetical protein